MTPFKHCLLLVVRTGLVGLLVYALYIIAYQDRRQDSNTEVPHADPVKTYPDSNAIRYT